MKAYDEIWGYPCERIREYLLNSGAGRDGDPCEADVYDTAGCRIVLETLPDRRVGKLTLPRTRVRMEGPGAEAYHQAFFLHFLSGGG